MVVDLLITGYFNKQNTGDDYFEHLAKQLFSSNRKYKITIKSIDNVKSNIEAISKLYTQIVLFGGETLNEYFLKPLAKIKKINQNIKLYAVSTGLGADPSMIKQYLVMFQYIIFRHKDDYNIISKMNISCYYVPDMVFMLYKNNKTHIINNNIGLFLSQPKNKTTDNLDYYINMITKYVNEGYIVKLFSMCYSNNNTESDLYLNKNIYYKLSNKIKRNVILVNKNSFDENIKTLKYAVCERFHAHVLCIIYNIPFISLANTDKAKKLLKDLELTDINFDMNKNKLKTVYKNIYPSVYNFYNKLSNSDLDDLIEYPKYKIRHFFTSDEIHKYCDNIYSNMNDTSQILINLFGTSNLEYKWGLQDKINKKILTFDDIKWLFEESILNFNYLHYKFNNNTNNTSINIDYIDQIDRTNVHRSGWKYIVNNISNKLGSFNNIYCDMYIDRTFHWCKEELHKAKIIPYKNEWYGFIHHTMYKDDSGYNCINLLKNDLFIESLDNCKGLIFLSNYLKNNFEKLAKMNKIELPKLFVLHHPTEFVNNKWKYKNWNNNIIQIGSWMRDLNAINQLNIKNKKFSLIGKEMESKYISYGNNNINNNININNGVELINYLDNDEYDNILSKYVVFIKLYDASAVNTLIECIVRNTPIIVNKLPAIVEYLGEDYPLYYHDINEVPKLLNIKWYNNKIKKAHRYLKNMNKDHLKIETFIKELNKIVT
jgi:polysaccharide pyruvyl transferase WcaK-like protein